MQVPTQNILWMLCYAWDREFLIETISADARQASTPLDLFATLLEAGVSNLRRRGLDRGYLERSEETRRPRGRIDFAATVGRALRRQGRVHVHFEELSRNVLHNQLILTTIRKLSVTDDDLDNDLRTRLRHLSARLPDIESVELWDGLFDRVVIHRNNAGYALLLHICRIVHRRLVPSKEPGRYTFRDFEANDSEMGLVFESFVRRFLCVEGKHLPGFRPLHGVFKRVPWSAQLAEGAVRVPEMRVDTFVPAAGGRSIIIETKCVQSWLPDQSVNPAHLYQLFAYLRNYHQGNSDEPAPMGMLLYATTGESFAHDYWIHEHPVQVRSLRLDRPWEAIHADLLSLAEYLAPVVTGAGDPGLAEVSQAFATDGTNA